MPFDPAPIQPKVGRFQHIADAILRGCAISGKCCYGLADDFGNTCAFGALLLGTGRISATSNAAYLSFAYTDEELQMDNEYFVRYGHSIVADNDRRGGLTREQIAARIAAL